MLPISLTSSQQLIWLGQQLSPDSPLYNMVFTFKIKGNINEDLFKKAFQLLGEESDALRTTIHVEDALPFQQISENFNYDLPIFDFTKNHDNWEEEVDLWLNSKKIEVFQLDKVTFDSALLRIPNGYIWYFNEHHITSDGWSFGVLYHRLMELYVYHLDHDRGDAINSLPTLKKYLLGQANTNDNDGLQLNKTYWKEKVSNLPDPINWTNQIVKNTGTKAERIQINLGVERTQKVKELVNRDGFRSLMKPVTLMNIFSTVTYTLIHLISESNEVALGLPFHNRRTREEKSSAGLFMEMFPTSVDISPEETFYTLFQKIRDENFNLLKHAQAGLSTAEIVKSFQVVLNFIPVVFKDFDQIPTDVNWLLPNHIDAQHHMKIQIADFTASENYTLYCDFNNDIFPDEDTRKYIINLFISLLDQLIENPSLSLKECELLDEHTSDKILKEFNNTDKEYEEEGTLINLFEKQAQISPDIPALKYENEVISYAELNERSNQLANYLEYRGVKNGDVVGLMLNRSFEMVIGIMAIQKVGAAYLPLEPTYPENRINYMVRHSQVKLIVTRKTHLSGFRDFIEDYVCLKDEREDISKQKNTYTSDTKLTNTAYVIYTSGSTGKPKGVMIGHQAIKNRILWMQDTFPIDKKDKVLQKTPFSFDVSVWEFIWPLITGAQLVIAKPEGHKDNLYLQELIFTEGITITHFVPSMLSLFLRHANLDKCNSLKHVFSSGEALPKAMAQNFLNHLKTTKLHNLYGPTEAAVDVTHWTCDLSDGYDQVPIGKPVSNTQVYLLNKSLNPVPLGFVGDLYLGGVQLAKGYLNNEELTNERFIKNPFDKSGKTKIYRTGDLASFNKDGVLNYHGRSDFQVKLRGFRIELGEIENVLLKLPLVLKVKVILVENKPIDKKLVAFLVVAEFIDAAEIKLKLSKLLPEYMIPSSFVPVSEMPLTPNGKIDMKLLISQYEDNSNSRNEEKLFVAPRNEMEEFIAEIWVDVFGFENISVDDGFLELGGHSLIAIRIAARIREQLEIDIPINAIFETQTISLLANYLEVKIEKMLLEDDL